MIKKLLKILLEKITGKTEKNDKKTKINFQKNTTKTI